MAEVFRKRRFSLGKKKEGGGEKSEKPPSKTKKKLPKKPAFYWE